WTTIRVANYRGKFDVEMVNPLALAASIRCPVFMVHGTADQLISAAHSEIIHAALGGEKEIWFVEGAGHARAVRLAKIQYCLQITKFLGANLSELKDYGSAAIAKSPIHPITNSPGPPPPSTRRSPDGESPTWRRVERASAADSGFRGPRAVPPVRLPRQ